jgi:hypothetical protein
MRSGSGDGGRVDGRVWLVAQGAAAVEAGLADLIWNQRQRSIQLHEFEQRSIQES